MTKPHPRFARDYLLILLLPALFCGGQAVGQDPRETAIVDLAKRVPTAADDEIIRDWVTWKISLMLRQPDPSEFLNDLTRIYELSTVEVFKTQFLKVVSSVFVAELSNNKAMSGSKAAVLVRSLGQFQRVEVFEGLVAALKHPESEVRYLAARTFGEMKKIVSEDQFGRQAMVDAIVGVATNESNGVVLRAMYHAVQFDQLPAESLVALTKIITAQAGVARSVPAADGAESTAFRFIKVHRDRLNPNDKIALAKSIAGMLKCHATRYLNATLTPEWQTAHLYGMIGSEDVLVALLGPGVSDVGNLKKALSEDPGSREINIRLQLTNWVGTDQNSSALNKAPYNMPVGLPNVNCP
jgi:hypothetical protein